MYGSRWPRGRAPDDLGADRSRDAPAGPELVRHDDHLRGDRPVHRERLGRPAGRAERVHLLDRRLPRLPDPGRPRHGSARADVPAGGFALRLDAEGTRPLLGLLRRLLRLVARHPRHGRDGRRRGHLWQFIDTGGLPKAWEQGLVILAVLWFSAAMALLRLRMTQNYANVAVVFYGAAIFVIGLAGILFLIGNGHSATTGWGTADNWNFHSGTWTLFGLVILALLGIEVPLNMGVEIVHMRAIKKYLFWGSIVVMAAYLWATLGMMLALPASQSQAATTDILRAVQVGFWDSHAFAVVVGLVLIWFFVANTIVYNYSFSRLLFVSGLEQRMPPQLGRVNDKTKVPVYAIVTQTVLSSIFVVAIFNPWVSGNNNQKAYWLFQAAV